MNRRRLLVTLGGVLAAGTMVGAQTLTTRVPRMTLKEFKALLAKKAVLPIDVRDSHSFEAGHIPGAMSVPFVDIEIRANALLKEKRPIVAYCA